MIDKQQLFEHCLSLAEARISSIRQTIDGFRKASLDESKSSMGDKYETTKSMLQYEQEKMTGQLNDALKIKKAMVQIGCKAAKEKVEAGSLVTTTGPTFYLLASLGKIDLSGDLFFVISPVSPIGQQLLNKKVGEELVFNQLKISIKEIN